MGGWRWKGCDCARVGWEECGGEGEGRGGERIVSFPDPRYDICTREGLGTRLGRGVWVCEVRGGRSVKYARVGWEECGCVGRGGGGGEY